MFGAFDYYYVAKTGSSYYWVEPILCQLQDPISFPTGYTPVKIFSTSQTYSTLYYWHCLNTDTNRNEILRYYLSGYSGSKISPFSAISIGQNKGYICGNFFIDQGSSNFGLRWVYVDNVDPDITSREYLLLRRDDGENFTLIERESYPFRVDISNNTPVLTVGSGEMTFTSNYVYDTSLVVVEPTLSGTRGVNDYRYTLLEPTFGGLTSSGLGVSNMILYVSGSGIYGSDALSYSGGFNVIFGVPSGVGTRIETSNFGVGGQYVFITASGNVQTFYQKDPGEYAFTAWSGMPQSRATIIRLDDAV
jgi:hypothetical protein